MKKKREIENKRKLPRQIINFHVLATALAKFLFNFCQDNSNNFLFSVFLLLAWTLTIQTLHSSQGTFSNKQL